MAPRSAKLYIKLAMAACVQISIQFTYSIAFSLTGPLFDDQFQLPSLGVNCIFALVGPLIGFFVQPIMGAIGDRCTFKFGRRRIFIAIGAIIDIIGTLMLCFAAVIDDSMHEDDASGSDSASASTSDTTADHVVGIIIGICGIFVAFFGVNIMQAPSRAIVSDIFDAENQQDANLMINAFCGIASVCCFIISGCMTLTDMNVYAIMFGICSIVVVIATLPTIFFAKEKRFVIEDGQKGNFFQPFIDLFVAIKSINLNVVFILLSLMLGWFAYQPMSTNFTVWMQKLFEKTVHEEDYPNNDKEFQQKQEEAGDLGLMLAMFIMALFAAVQCISVVIFPFITAIIGEIFTFVLFQGLAAISYAMMIVINYTFPDHGDLTNEENKAAFYSCLVLGFMAVIFPAMAFVQTNSLPYSMLKRAVPDEKYGVFVGLLNCSVVIAQFLASTLIVIIQFFESDYVVAFYVATGSAILCCLGSTVLFFVKTEGTEGEKEKLIVENQEVE